MRWTSFLVSGKDVCYLETGHPIVRQEELERGESLLKAVSISKSLSS
ncbi:protein of unknown function [Methylocaldum szegediense]|uniref:Uncharacterized protein n=1 Tax=Methylocaldum szegediense TaxID=73780 RepID=A0ABM9I7W7_9GAMM|nr:protein of unknown function [Methylocaldum szegediense]